MLISVSITNLSYCFPRPGTFVFMLSTSGRRNSELIRVRLEMGSIAFPNQVDALVLEPNCRRGSCGGRRPGFVLAQLLDEA